MSHAPVRTSVARERAVALAALVASVLVVAISVDIGRTALHAALSGLTAYGTLLILAALGLSVGLRAVWAASRTVLAVAVVIALALYGMGRALAGVIA
jgi:hypothetical protein